MNGPRMLRARTAAIKMTAILLTILLAGCGSGSGDADPESAANNTPPPVTPDPGPAPDPSPDPGPDPAPPTATFFAPDFVTAGQSFIAVAETAGTNEVTHDWAIPEAPAGSSPSVTENGIAAAFLTDVAGQYSISHTVTDGNGNSSTATKNVTALSPTVGSVITTVQVNSLASQSETYTSVPVTFGQVFVEGDVPPGYTVDVRLENGEAAPLQVDPKTWYPDGSLKHAVLSSVIPSLRGGEQLALEIISCEEREPLPPVEIGDLSPDYDAIVAIESGNASYTASLRQGMLSGPPKYWLSGPVATEAHYLVPFVDQNDNPHSLLTARFQLRLHQNGIVRTDVIVENTAAFVPGASNLDYTAQVTAGGQVVMAAEQIAHRHHSRWRKTFWFGSAPELHLQHDLPYLTATGVVPNYDQSVNLSPSTLSSLLTSWEQSSQIMGPGVAKEYMPHVGGRLDIGLLPGWISMYLLTWDEGAAAATYGTADAAAHWQIHYRDGATDLPLSLEDYPNTTTHSNVFGNPSNPLPQCNNCGGNGLTPDTAHQPSMVFIPYVLTGDHYYLEELHFWTNWNSFETGPENRNFGDATYGWQETRGQAWSMRTLLQTVFITPDDHPLKSYFQTQLDNNFDFFMTTYVNNPGANQLGWIRNGWINPDEDWVIVFPWQDDFFTMIMNYARHLGFERAQPLLEWKIQFAMNRMTDPVYCWQFATVYKLVASLPGPGAFYDNMADTYVPTLEYMHSSLDLQAVLQAECGSQEMATIGGFQAPGDLVGHPGDPLGYPAGLRPVLAAALELGLPDAAVAWSRVRNAPTQPGFHVNPSFAINPR